jgi:3-oxoacyl-[acyl-carrier-protein] synthase II
MTSSNGNHRPQQGRRVVVTGIGAVSPNGVGREIFWDAVRAGRSGVKPITAFDVSQLPTRIAGIVDGFDPADVMSANDLKHVPRVVPMALKASIEAVADAGLDPGAMDLDERRRFGVVIGSGARDWNSSRSSSANTRRSEGVSLYTIPSSTPGSLSSELDEVLLRGPSHVISTGCTSSTDAIGHALSLIRYAASTACSSGAATPDRPGI